jgi:hypothetical protein
MVDKTALKGPGLANGAIGPDDLLSTAAKIFFGKKGAGAVLAKSSGWLSSKVIEKRLKKMEDRYLKV